MMYKVNTKLVPQYLKSVTLVTSVHTDNTWLAARCALYTCYANLKHFTRSFKINMKVLDNGMI